MLMGQFIPGVMTAYATSSAGCQDDPQHDIDTRCITQWAGQAVVARQEGICQTWGGRAFLPRPDNQKRGRLRMAKCPWGAAPRAQESTLWLRPDHMVHGGVYSLHF